MGADGFNQPAERCGAVDASSAAEHHQRAEGGLSQQRKSPAARMLGEGLVVALGTTPTAAWLAAFRRRKAPLAGG